MKHSNTYALYKNGWRGINIDLEPAKIIAFKLWRHGDVNVLSAVSDQTGTVAVYGPKRYSVLTTIDSEHAKNCGFHEIAKIPCDTLTSILDRSRFSGRMIDLLSIDVEGVDDKVLTGLDFTRYNPWLVVIESYCKNLDDILSSNVHALLSARGYRLINWVGLSLFYRRYPEQEMPNAK